MPPSLRAHAPILLAVLVAFSSAAQEPGDRFVETIEVRVADIDVVVTDRDGNPLTDLERDDFEIYDDGKRVEIAYFSRIVEGRLEAEAEGANTVERAEDVRAPLTWALFIDQANMRPARRNEALRGLATFLEGAMVAGDRALVATFDGMAFRVRGGFVTDRDELLAILSGMERERAAPGPVYTQEGLLRGEILRAPPGDEEVGQILGFQVSTMIAGETARQRHAVAALSAVVDLMAGVEGRQAVVYLGAGFNTIPALGVTEAWRRRFPSLADRPGAPRPEDEQFRIEQAITDLYTRVTGSRVTFYSILSDTGDGMMLAEDLGLDVNEMTAPPVPGEIALLGQAASTRELAERTGGRYFKVSRALDRQMEVVTRDLTHYYSLGWVPQSPPGQQRRVTVKVNVEGARVRHREALRERTPDEQASDAVVAALFDPAAENALGVGIEIDAPKRAGLTQGSLVPVRLKVPLASLAFLRRDEVYEGGLSFHVALAARDGSIWRVGSRELPLEIPAAERASVNEQHITYSFEVPLPGAGARIAVSVHDRFAPQIRSIVTAPLGGR